MENSFCDYASGVLSTTEKKMIEKENEKETNSNERGKLYKTSKGKKFHLSKECYYIKGRQFSETLLKEEIDVNHICKICQRTIVSNLLKSKNNLSMLVVQIKEFQEKLLEIEMKEKKVLNLI